MEVWLTGSREAKLSAYYIGIIGVPASATNTPPHTIHTHFNSSFLRNKTIHNPGVSLIA